MIIKQGDAYCVPIALQANGAPLLADAFEQAEVFFGPLCKKYPEDMSFQDGCLLFPLTQKETLSFEPGTTMYIDVRVGFSDGTCIGIPEKVPVLITGATSKEVL